MLRSKKEAEKAFARKCYTTLMDRLQHRISRDEFNERLAALDAELHPPVQQTIPYRCLDCGSDPCICREDLNQKEQ